MSQQTLEDCFLSDKSLSKRYQVGRSTIWRWSQEGHLPKPIKIANGCTRWKLSSIEEWESQRARG